MSDAVHRIARLREAVATVAIRGSGIRMIVESPNRFVGQGEYDCLLAFGDNVASGMDQFPVTLDSHAISKPLSANIDKFRWRPARKSASLGR